MATASLFAAVLRRSRPRILRFRVHESSKAFSTADAYPSGEVIVGDPSNAAAAAAAEADLRSRILRLRLAKRSVTVALDQLVGEGREIKATELRQIAKELRRKQRYKHALEISEWMKHNQESELSDSDYAMRIDLTTKVFGVNAAEEFFQGLPSTAKSCVTYTALLHSYAAAKLTDKAEKLFENVKESNLFSNALAFNEMMTLYISTGQLDKVTLVVDEMKRLKVSPDLFTYNLWISASAATLDVDAVRRILDEMSHDSNSAKGWTTYMKLTDIYLTAGHLVSSDCSLVEADAKITQREWITYDFLIILHAGLDNQERIAAIWKSLKMASPKMTSRNYISIISSYLMLEHWKEAGEVIDEWMQSKTENFDIGICNRIFDAFLKIGLVDKAEMFRNLMHQRKCKLGIEVLESSS